jgi:selenocysteine-specific elongation factor
VTGPPLVVATAGHVDHGKTALVLALTGRDTDRLPQEKARGISIELGVAPLRLPSGRVVSLVDVPGHERFVRHMVAGASGVDGYLLCVAADDGVMPQTREHLDVLRLLGVADGVVAITKVDLARPDLAAEEVRDLVGEGPEIVAVCAPTGHGRAELLAALERLAARLGRRMAAGRPRLFVDRSFTVTGAGTVVTGTLWGGPLRPGDRVRALPHGAEARVRRVEVHDRPAAEAAGGRVALNLAGVERDEVPRGCCVVRAGDGWTVTERLDVALDWLPGAGPPLRTRRRLQAFLGTAELPATCVLLDRDEIPPGGRGYVQLRLDRALPAEAGDRVVLRSAERRTVGGATVIDPRPPRHGRGSPAARRLAVLESGRPEEVAALRLREAGGAGVPAPDPQRDALLAAGAVLLGPRAVDPEVAARARAALCAAAARGPVPLATVPAVTGLAPPAAEALADALVREGILAREGRRLVASGRVRDPAVEEVARVLAAAGLRPPGPSELAERAGLDRRELLAALAALCGDGRAVRAGDLWFDAAAAESARRAAERALAAGPRSLGELRDLWGVGRRHALALAAHLDRSGLTRRQGDLRVLRRGAAR